ncbi:hypothetical protein KY362_04495, partial [Candidatus Woesearchaeota archaeon]|nr:hypothetical protein [Candidatus Woesearchaeota archaeon]
MAEEDLKKTLPLGSGGADSGNAIEEALKDFKLDAETGAPEVPKPPKPEEQQAVRAGADYFTELAKVRELMDNWLEKHRHYAKSSDPREAELAKRFMNTRKEMAELLGNLILDVMKKYRKNLDRITDEDIEIETFQKSRRFLDIIPEEAGQDSLIAEIRKEHYNALLEGMDKIGKKLVSLLEEGSFEDAFEEYKKATIFIHHLIKDEETKKKAQDILSATLGRAISAYRKYFFEKGALEEDAEKKFNRAYEFMQYITDKAVYKKAHLILEEIQFIIKQFKTAKAAIEKNENYLQRVLERFAKEGAEKKGLAAFLLEESEDKERVDFLLRSQTYGKMLQDNADILFEYISLLGELEAKDLTDDEKAAINKRLTELDAKITALGSREEFKGGGDLHPGKGQMVLFENPEQLKIIPLDIGRAYTSFILTNAALQGTIAHAPNLKNSMAWTALKKRHEHLKKVHSELMRNVLKAVKAEIKEVMEKNDKTAADTLIRAAKPWRDSNMSKAEWTAWAKPLDRLRDWVAGSPGGPTATPSTTPSGGSMPSGLKDIEKHDIKQTVESVSRRIKVNAQRAIEDNKNVDVNEALCDTLEISVSKLDSLLSRSDIDAQTREDAENLRTRIDAIAKEKINHLYPQVQAATEKNDLVLASDFLLLIHRMANL